MGQLFIHKFKSLEDFTEDFGLLENGCALKATEVTIEFYVKNHDLKYSFFFTP
ncbi:MAG: hypothetical protein Fur0010_09730 [Bdellovibrio sp.]